MKNMILILLIMLGFLHAEVKNNNDIDYKKKFSPYTTKEIVSNSAKKLRGQVMLMLSLFLLYFITKEL